MVSSARSSINRTPTKSEIASFKKFLDARKLDLENQVHEIESRFQDQLLKVEACRIGLNEFAVVMHSKYRSTEAFNISNVQLLVTSIKEEEERNENYGRQLNTQSSILKSTKLKVRVEVASCEDSIKALPRFFSKAEKTRLDEQKQASEAKLLSAEHQLLEIEKLHSQYVRKRSDIKAELKKLENFITKYENASSSRDKLEEKLRKLNFQISEIIRQEKSSDFGERAKKHAGQKYRATLAAKKKREKATSDALNLKITELRKREKRLSKITGEIELTDEVKLEGKLKKLSDQVSKRSLNLKRVEDRINDWFEQNTYPIKTKPLYLRGGGVTQRRIEIDKIDLARHPTLHNLVRKRTECRVDLKRSRDELGELDRALTRLGDLKKEAVALEKRITTLSRSAKIRALDKPPKMSIENWKDAEVFAEKYMRWLGFSDAKVTSEGSDEGKDVDSARAVAQVKDMGTGVSRPMVQQLNGVAAAERKIPLFFARSYAATARDWGEKHDMALFQFSLKGDVKPISLKAKDLLTKRKQ
jgi:hypothetical protein